MNNVTIAVAEDAVLGGDEDGVMTRLRDVHGLRPDMLTVDFSAAQVADAGWLAMLHLVLLDVEDSGALVLLDCIPTSLGPTFEATGMHTAFFCRYQAARSS